MEVNFLNQKPCIPSWPGVLPFNILFSVVLTKSMCISVLGLSLSLCFSHQLELILFHSNHSENRSLQVSRELFRILASLSNSVISMALARPLISNSSSPLTKPWGQFPARQLIMLSPSCWRVFPIGSNWIVFQWKTAWWVTADVADSSISFSWCNNLIIIIRLVSSFHTFPNFWGSFQGLKLLLVSHSPLYSQTVRISVKIHFLLYHFGFFL